jgi:hypothetical protein
MHSSAIGTAQLTAFTSIADHEKVMEKLPGMVKTIY